MATLISVTLLVKSKPKSVVLFPLPEYGIQTVSAIISPAPQTSGFSVPEAMGIFFGSHFSLTGTPHWLHAVRVITEMTVITINEYLIIR